MRQDYDGVKYYRGCFYRDGDEFNRAKQILDSFDVGKTIGDINEALELYNIYQIIVEGGIDEELINRYRPTANMINKAIALFFKSITDNNLMAFHREINIHYYDDFWTLFDKYKSYNSISDSVFSDLLNQPETALFRVLEHKSIVKHFDNVIAAYLRQSKRSGEIIIKKFLESREHNSGFNQYLPSSLKPSEYEDILQRFIDSNPREVGLIELIAIAQSSAECPISDKLRLKASKHVKHFWQEQQDAGTGFSYGVGICFKDMDNLIETKKAKNGVTIISYDKKWLEENLDYPTILNNFIYLFEYVNLHNNCAFPSTETQLGTFERFLGVKGIKEYRIGAVFRATDMKSNAEIKMYYDFLSEHSIRLEDVIGWFFNAYLKKEFGVDGFVVNMPSPGSTLLEKCRNLSSEMDGVFKQFKLYVENGVIDRELLEISSNHVIIKDIPSMINNKYVYSNSNDIEREIHLMFSDQSMLNYIHKLNKTYKSFYELLLDRKMKVDDYSDWRKPSIDWLINRNAIQTNSDGTILFNRKRIKILRDLYRSEVVCPSYYSDKSEINRLIELGELRYESSLFSRPEQSYFNYMLNKSEFSNGLDLRNKYIHSTYPDEKQQGIDYCSLLKLMIVVVLKINEEFRLVNG